VSVVPPPLDDELLPPLLDEEPPLDELPGYPSAMARPAVPTPAMAALAPINLISKRRPNWLIVKLALKRN
jgi:hypothetical protein